MTNNKINEKVKSDNKNGKENNENEEIQEVVEEPDELSAVLFLDRIRSVLLLIDDIILPDTLYNASSEIQNLVNSAHDSLVDAYETADKMLEVGFDDAPYKQKIKNWIDNGAEKFVFVSKNKPAYVIPITDKTTIDMKHFVMLPP